MDTYKLDALVAEKIMEWPVIPIQEWDDNGPIQCVVLLDKYGRTRTQIGWKMWRPSANLTATFEMVEKATKERNVRLSLYQEWNGKWVASFGTAFETNFDQEGYAETPAQAICLAALSLYGVEVPA